MTGCSREKHLSVFRSLAETDSQNACLWQRRARTKTMASEGNLDANPHARMLFDPLGVLLQHDALAPLPLCHRFVFHMIAVSPTQELSAPPVTDPVWIARQDVRRCLGTS